MNLITNTIIYTIYTLTTDLYSRITMHNFSYYVLLSTNHLVE